VLKDALRWIIARSVMVAGAVLMILAFIVFATNMPNRSFLTMTLTQWGYVVGCLAAMFTGFALFFIGGDFRIKGPLGSRQHPVRRGLRLLVGLVLLSGGLLLLASCGLMWLLATKGGAQAPEVQMLTTLAGMALVALGLIWSGFRKVQGR
jgi:hypothetical protein